MSKNRIYFFDNLKGVLIFLVVLGHYILPIHSISDPMNGVYEFIYLFHMPLFIFISGFFSKSIFKNGNLRIEKIISLVVLVGLFQISLTLIERYDNFDINYLLDFGSAPWYLVSLICYYLLIPFFIRVHPVVAIAGGFLISLGINCFDAAGDFLAISRTLVFLPFFLLGFYCGKEEFLKIKNIRIISFSPAVLVLLLIVFLATGGILGSDQYIIYGNTAYKGSFITGMGLRLFVFTLAAIISLGVICLTPRNKTFLATIGERTLQIYVLHRLIRPFLDSFGLFDLAIFADPVIGVLFAVVLSILITLLCALRILKKPFDLLLNMDWKRLVR